MNLIIYFLTLTLGTYCLHFDLFSFLLWAKSSIHFSLAASHNFDTNMYSFPSISYWFLLWTKVIWKYACFMVIFKWIGFFFFFCILISNLYACYSEHSMYYTKYLKFVRTWYITCKWLIFFKNSTCTSPVRFYFYICLLNHIFKIPILTDFFFFCTSTY